VSERKQILVGFSGKKQAGKGEACKFLTENAGVLWPGASVRKFSMAGPLKRFCVEILGLEPEQVYGTNEQKDSLTRYRWEDLPHYADICRGVDQHNMTVKCWRSEHYEWGEVRHPVYAYWNYEGTYPHRNKLPGYREYPSGQMTARQVLQEVGTGIFRRMWSDVWNQACLREIRNSGVDVAFVDDVRFPDEVFAMQAAGGFVLRLPRDVFGGQDVHESERALDRDRFDWSKFDAVVGDGTDTLREQNLLVLYHLATNKLADPHTLILPTVLFK
jgi:hypothetical protein